MIAQTKCLVCTMYALLVANHQDCTTIYNIRLSGKLGLMENHLKLRTERGLKKSQCTVKHLFTAAICVENFRLRFVYAKNAVGIANHCQVSVDYHSENIER